MPRRKSQIDHAYELKHDPMSAIQAQASSTSVAAAGSQPSAAQQPPSRNGTQHRGAFHPSMQANAVANASSLPPPPSQASAVLSYLVPADDPSARVRLVEGKHVIGRSAVPLEDRWFVNLESPRSAVSRNHAAVVVCRNGDAWVEDNSSTNGTFLAIRDGDGVKLEPMHYYQLGSRAQVIVGDVEMVFTQEPGGGAGASQMPARTPSRSAGPAGGGDSQSRSVLPLVPAAPDSLPAGAPGAGAPAPPARAGPAGPPAPGAVAAGAPCIHRARRRCTPVGSP